MKIYKIKDRGKDVYVKGSYSADCKEEIERTIAYARKQYKSINTEASYKINPFELKDVINITGGQIQIIDVEETDIEIK